MRPLCPCGIGRWPIAAHLEPAQAKRANDSTGAQVTSNPADRGYTCALLAVLIWALVPVATRYFVLRVDPFMFNAIRFAAAGTAALPLAARVKPWRWCRRDQLLLLACAALSVPGYNVPASLGARTVPAGEMGVLIATESLMIAALTLIIERRAVKVTVIGGSLIALAGVALTSGIVTARAHLHALGTLQVLAGALSWSLYTVLAGRLNQRHGALGVTGATLLIGSLELLALSWPQINRAIVPDGPVIAMLAAMGIATSLVGFLLWNHASATMPPERLGLFLYMIPLISIGAGAALLSESLTAATILGAALVVSGVWIAARRGRTLSDAFTG
jgi:probable blue pigment (indigoidine) exporter